jgi:hypothetical protein
VKRDLIIPTADEYGKFYNLVARNSQALGWLGRRLCDSKGRVRAEFKGKSIRGTDSDDYWILMITKIPVDHKMQYQGIGRTLAGAILGHILLWAAQQTPSRGVLTIAEPSILLEEQERFQRSQSRAPEDLPGFLESSIERAKKFSQSLGFVQLGNTVYFEWRRSVVSDPALLQLPPSEGEKEHEYIAEDLETLSGGEGKIMSLLL